MGWDRINVCMMPVVCTKSNQASRLANGQSGDSRLPHCAPDEVMGRSMMARRGPGYDVADRAELRGRRRFVVASEGGGEEAYRLRRGREGGRGDVVCHSLTGLVEQDEEMEVTVFVNWWPPPGELCCTIRASVLHNLTHCDWEPLTLPPCWEKRRAGKRSCKAGGGDELMRESRSYSYRGWWAFDGLPGTVPQHIMIRVARVSGCHVLNL
ncbi:hypothetical protein EX30DRAFT_75856 [Ascodesmis nigricans]|uniref:Uncharacterized protein n=1 Tax=Ascodesmis nigricans TaxID=341454 RepID=A0A4S2MTG3_9PEZI|nr:hypothetical protein EX30DRAFT_75856 [Ascodesmis nigricans]